MLRGRPAAALGHENGAYPRGGGPCPHWRTVTSPWTPDRRPAEGSPLSPPCPQTRAGIALRPLPGASHESHGFCTIHDELWRMVSALATPASLRAHVVPVSGASLTVFRPQPTGRWAGPAPVNSACCLRFSLVGAITVASTGISLFPPAILWCAPAGSHAIPSPAG